MGVARPQDGVMAAPETADTAAQMAEAAHAADHGAAYDPSAIVHHVEDAHYIDIPFVTRIELPHWEIAGYDVSITKHVVMLWIVSVLLLVLLRLAVRRASDPVPRGLRNALEILILFVRDDVAKRTIGHGFEPFLPYLLTTFFFILTANLVGMVPGMATATGNLSVTAALAVVAFFMFQWAGIREHGVVAHFKHLVPPGLPVFILPVMIVVEVLSMLVRPFALCIRLFANMMAGHLVIGAFISLILLFGVFMAPPSIAFALFIHFLELLVAFLQAYIFTVLTSQFIALSVHPAH
jgi:F-type H+-transporting ATPase subunit a